MPSAGSSGGRESAARVARAVERGTTTLGVQLARSLYGRWRRMPAERRSRLEGLAADVRERALGSDRPSGDHGPGASGDRLPDAIVAAAKLDPEVSDIDVRDLRAELARELERLAGADIRAARGPGGVAGEKASGGGEA